MQKPTKLPSRFFVFLEQSLPTLRYRRHRGDMIEVFKILHKIYDIETVNTFKSRLDEGYGVDVIYLDYKKAFDTVTHKRLVNKLEHLGFAGGLLNWLKAFLTNRTMRVWW